MVEATVVEARSWPGVVRDELRPPHLPPSQYSPDRLKRAAYSQYAYRGHRGVPFRQ